MRWRSAKFIFVYSLCGVSTWLFLRNLLFHTLLSHSKGYSKYKVFSEGDGPSEMLPPELSSPFWWRVRENVCQSIFNSSWRGSLMEMYRINAQMDIYAHQQITNKSTNVGRILGRDSCKNYLNRLHFVQKSHSEEEKNFPLAYSIVVYKDYAQIENLLRTIYRPEHVICIHVDGNIRDELLNQLLYLVQCFSTNNVFISARSVNVTWGTFLTLKADLLCMEQLWQLWPTRKWKYFINLTGQEFPLRTNLELVRILKLLNGSNAMEAISRNYESQRVPRSNLSFPIQWVKGAAHIVATAAFVNFSLNDRKALEIQNLLEREGKIPDEFYFSTLNHNPHLKAPGAYLGQPTTDEVTYPYINRAKEWILQHQLPSPRCLSNRSVRGICIWGMLDVPRLMTMRALFINKFHWDFQHLALECLQEWYWERTRSELLSPRHDVDVDLSWFANLPQAKNHI